MRLIHLTDPHLSSLEQQSFLSLRGKRRSGYLSWYKKRRHVHRPEILEQLTLAVRAESPDQVLLSGDLVHIGLEQEMVEAAQWLRRLGPPEKVILIPGNHDNYAADSNAAMVRHWGEYLPADARHGTDYAAGYPVARELANVKLLGVNTSCVTRIFSAAGELGREQQSRLSRALERDPGDDRFHCLLIHHPPMPGMTKRRKALRDAKQLAGILGLHPPDLVLYGHIHSNREHQFGDARIYCTASASSVGTASYRVFDVENDERGWTCRMRLMTLDNSTGPGDAFSLSEKATWARTTT
jgi:3',5'-cyclic AMP phosphodiesterase CpdA